MDKGCTYVQTEPRDENGLTEKEFLEGYDIKKYERPSVTVDSAVLGRDDAGRTTVLLIKRRNHPFIGKWALPGGFLNMDESPEQGAARELFEEAGVKGVTLRQIGAYGRPDRDPRGRIITIAYLSLLPEGACPKAGDDARDAAMFTVSVDSAAKAITLACRERGEAFSFPYVIEGGRACFIPCDRLAGDHTQILTDALMLAGELII